MIEYVSHFTQDLNYVSYKAFLIKYTGCNLITEVDPMRKAAKSVAEVTVMETPACFMA